MNRTPDGTLGHPPRSFARERWQAPSFLSAARDRPPKCHDSRKTRFAPAGPRPRTDAALLLRRPGDRPQFHTRAHRLRRVYLAIVSRGSRATRGWMSPSRASRIGLPQCRGSVRAGCGHSGEPQIGRARGRQCRPRFPTHSTPVESSKRQFTFSDGKPSAVLGSPRPFDSALKPLGVANHMVPSDLRESTPPCWKQGLSHRVVVNLPFLSMLTPALSVPAQTVPSRAR